MSTKLDMDMLKAISGNYTPEPHPQSCECCQCLGYRAAPKHDGDATVCLCEECRNEADADEMEAEPDPNPRVCQFDCEHECTLVGHAHEAIRFLNQCLEHGIVRSAVEEDPQYKDLMIELSTLTIHLLKRTPRK